MGDAFVVWRPVPDRARYDLGASRGIFESAPAIALGIRVWTLAAGTDLALGKRSELRLAERAYLVSDANTLHRQSAEWSVLVSDHAGLRWTALVRGEALESAQRLDHGYYDPDAYGELAPGVAIAWTPRGAWKLETRVELGVEKESHAAAAPFTSESAGVEIPIAHAVALGLRVFRSDSHLGSDSGYKQRGWTASIITGR